MLIPCECFSHFDVLTIDNALRCLQPEVSTRWVDIHHSALGPSVRWRLVDVST